MIERDISHDLQRERARAAKDVTEPDHKLQEAAVQQHGTPKSSTEREVNHA